MKSSTRRKPETLDSIADVMERDGPAGARGRACAGAGADQGEERRAGGGGARDQGPDAPPSWPPTQRDLAEATRGRQTAAFLDRLSLDPKRIEAMAKGLEDIAALPDPVGTVLANGRGRTG